MSCIFLNIIVLVRVYIDRFIDYIFNLYYGSNRLALKKPENPLILESATSLARKIRERKITSEEVVQLFLDRIKEINPFINAVTDIRYEALNEAREIDQDIAKNKITANDFDTRPFLGVPFTTKESTACKGMKQTFGLLCRKDKVANEDADVITALKKAGGILIGVTNGPQLNMWQESSNPVFGITNNPYDLTKNTGGSSGGEASLIAACGSPFGIGTDIGGSIRIPAFKCGLFGHKTTSDLIPTKGLGYRTGEEKSTMVVAGPMTKYSEDLIPFLKVLTGDSASKLKLDEAVDVKDLQVYYMLDPKDYKVSSMTDEMKKILLRTLDYITENFKSEPQKLDVPKIKYGGRIWRYWLTQEENSNFFVDLTDRKGKISPYYEILKFLTGQGEYNIGCIAFIINNLLPKEKEKWARDLTEELKKDLLSKLQGNAVLLYPSAPWSAEHHNTTWLRPWNLNYFSVWNALKFPVTQVPLGLDSKGLPVGIQVVAAPYQDHLCIAVAKELEKAFGGYVPPFQVD